MQGDIGYCSAVCGWDLLVNITQGLPGSPSLSLISTQGTWRSVRLDNKYGVQSHFENKACSHRGGLSTTYICFLFMNVVETAFIT